jgi:hypothetical protein
MAAPLTVAGAARALHPVPMTCRSRHTVRENCYVVNQAPPTGLMGKAIPATTSVTRSHAAASI